jgi:hypothetical protein
MNVVSGIENGSRGGLQIRSLWVRVPPCSPCSVNSLVECLAVYEEVIGSIPIRGAKFVGVLVAQLVERVKPPGIAARFQQKDLALVMPLSWVRVPPGTPLVCCCGIVAQW